MEKWSTTIPYLHTFWAFVQNICIWHKSGCYSLSPFRQLTDNDKSTPLFLLIFYSLFSLFFFLFFFFNVNVSYQKTYFANFDRRAQKSLSRPHQPIWCPWHPFWIKQVVGCSRLCGEWVPLSPLVWHFRMETLWPDSSYSDGKDKDHPIAEKVYLIAVNPIQGRGAKTPAGIFFVRFWKEQSSYEAVNRP